MLTHVPELEARDDLSGVTGQHLAGRRHIERAPAPTADARVWEAGEIIGHHRVDDDLAAMRAPQPLDVTQSRLDLLTRRHQRGAVLQRPAVILDVRNLDARGAER